MQLQFEEVGSLSLSSFLPLPSKITALILALLH